MITLNVSQRLSISDSIVLQEAQEDLYIRTSPKPQCIWAISFQWSIQNINILSDSSGHTHLSCPLSHQHAVRTEMPLAQSVWQQFPQPAAFSWAYTERVKWQHLQTNSAMHVHYILVLSEQTHKKLPQQTNTPNKRWMQSAFVKIK